MSKIYMVIAGLTTAFVFVAFQNCSNDASFDVQDSQAGNVETSGSGDTTDPVDLSGETTSLGQILQVQGECDGGGSRVSVDGSNVGNTSCGCTNNSYTVCTLIQQSGESSVNVSQVGSLSNSQVVTLPINVTYPINFTQYFHIQSVVVNTTTSGTITVSCVPGSNISAIIYGNDVMVGGPQECSVDGSLTFDVNLVAGFAGTGQRVVTISQTTQAGFQTYVFADVDNVDNSHSCAISEWSVNTQICDGHAGSIAGSCKGGSPVKVLVNGELQQIVTCDENSSFVAEDLLLTNSGDLASNEITIEQYTPFGSACSASYSAF